MITNEWRMDKQTIPTLESLCDQKYSFVYDQPFIFYNSKDIVCEKTLQSTIRRNSGNERVNTWLDASLNMTEN